VTSLASTAQMSSAPASSQRGRSWSRVVIFFGVLSAHLTFLYCLNTDRPRFLESVRDQKVLTLVTVEPQMDRAGRPPGSPEVFGSPAPSVAPPAVLTPESVAIDQGDQAPPASGIDWHGEIGRAAKEAAAAVPQEQLRLPCREPRRAGDPPQIGCRPPPKLTEWEPEPPVAGFAGGLPFVRLGQRCAIGLGFFGCGIGEKPKPNGDVFKSMDDPDRPRSSVPEDPR
jgi:hypothetical protein